MNEDVKLISQRIRELREIFGVTQQEMANDLKISVEQYNSYEQDGYDIPISVIYHISQKFGVDMTEILTGKSAFLTTYEICRKGQGKKIERFEGYSFEGLAHRFNSKIMEPMIVTLDPSDEKPELVTHRGQEFNLVLSGSVIVTYDNKELLLNSGDSIYFDPTHPHGQHTTGDGTAVFLTVIVE